MGKTDTHSPEPVSRKKYDNLKEKAEKWYYEANDNKERMDILRQENDTLTQENEQLQENILELSKQQTNSCDLDIAQKEIKKLLHKITKTEENYSKKLSDLEKTHQDHIKDLTQDHKFSLRDAIGDLKEELRSKTSEIRSLQRELDNADKRLMKWELTDKKIKEYELTNRKTSP